MANQKDQKRKLLAIQKILLEKSDAAHPITLAQITEELAAQNIDAERKSIYACIEALRNSGMDIEMKRSPYPAYYLASRAFNYEEAVLLLNVIQTNPTINLAMRKRLVQRVESLLSEGLRAQARVRIDAPAHAGRRSSKLYPNLTKLQYAISHKSYVFFFYYSVGIDGKLAVHKMSRQTITYKSREDEGKRHRGKHYTFCIPVRLVYMSGYYYAVCWHAPSNVNQETGEENRVSSKRNNGKADTQAEGYYRTYRVDRMVEVHVAAENEFVPQRSRRAEYRPEEMEDPAFGMFIDGKGKQSITILVEDTSAQERGYSWIMGAFYDKFGEGMDVHKISETSARVFFKTVASPQFYSWLLQFGGAVKIEKPSKVAKEYVEGYLQPALARYE